MPDADRKRTAPPRTLIIAVALAVAGLVGFGASLLKGASTPSPQASGAPAASPVAEPNAVERIYFEAGNAGLPAQAAEALARIADAARASGASLQISGFHDSSGNLDRGPDAATRRTQAVAHALEANGVAPSRLIIATPVPASSGAEAREARRGDVRTQ